MFTDSLGHSAAQAVVPEQLGHYVTAVSGRRAALCQDFPAYFAQGDAVLAAYPTGREALEALGAPVFSAGVPEAAALPGALAPYCEALRRALCELVPRTRKLTVLSPLPPALWAAWGADCPQPESFGRPDRYWALPVPAAVPQKTRNMITRAAREVSVNAEAWGLEHEALVARYLQRADLAPGARVVFSNLSRYAPRQAPEQKDDGTWRLAPSVSSSASGPAHEGSVLLLGARGKDGSLRGCCIGDFSAFATAFYMFAFRALDAPPGTADLLLHGLLRQAREMGHTRMNLGLGIDAGISFFKQKWRAEPFLPYTESVFRQAPERRAGGIFGALREWLK